MNKILNHLIEKKATYRRFALLVIMGLLIINTLFIILIGGTPSVLAHTMYIPIILAAFYFGPVTAMITGVVGGLLVGPLMQLDFLNVQAEPFLNSLYRGVYFVALGGGIGLLFRFLQQWLNRLHIQNEELDATLMSIGDGVVTTDIDGVIVNINPLGATLLGLEYTQVIGHPFTEIFKLINHQTKEPSVDPIQAVLNQDGSVELEDNTVLINHKGETFHIKDSASPIHNSKGKLIGVVMVFHDVSEQKEREKKIQHITYHDYLTGISNRRFFEEQLVALKDPKYLPLGLAMIDLNALKLINDAYGYKNGNNALMDVAGALEEIKTNDEVIARIGGDEFAIISPNTSDTRLQNIKTHLDAVIANKPIGGITYSLAFGYALKKNEKTSIRTILKEAEDKMYKHKVLFSETTRNNAIFSILNTLTDKFDEEKHHSNRVAHFCKKIGEKMQLQIDEIKELELAGRLHDIGKITVPDAILKKPGRLTQEEWTTMTRHTVNGYQILRTADQYSKLAEYAMSHHERFDGQGYPNQLKGEAIPLFARIICVADAFEAMISHRPYRKALRVETALEELKKHSGTQFDTNIVKLFTEDVYPTLNLSKTA